jgi:hypothetical protein
MKFQFIQYFEWFYRDQKESTVFANDSWGVVCDGMVNGVFEKL